VPLKIYGSPDRATKNMAFSKKQAQAKAHQIFERFGMLIHLACLDAGVSDSFLAGFTGVEAGIDHDGQFKPTATRFEPGVFEDLKSLRDNGYCFVGGRKMKTYSGVAREQIKDCDDAALRALATSYSFSQIMGWHCINNLKCTIADLRDPEKHFGFTVKLLKIVGGVYMRRGDLVSVLHIWNTGSANGKTYHEDYVTNALAVKDAYEEILKAHPDAFKQQAEPAQTDELPAQEAPASFSGTPESEAPSASIDAQPGSQSPASDNTANGSAPLSTDGDAVKVTNGLMGKVMAMLGGPLAALAAVWGFISNHENLIVVGILCGTAIVLAIIFRQVILDWVRMQLHADPKMYNVR
jgi:hypothetical protein